MYPQTNNRYFSRKSAHKVSSCRINTKAHGYASTPWSSILHCMMFLHDLTVFNQRRNQACLIMCFVCPHRLQYSNVIIYWWTWWWILSPPAPSHLQTVSLITGPDQQLADHIHALQVHSQRKLSKQFGEGVVVTVIIRKSSHLIPNPGKLHCICITCQLYPPSTMLWRMRPPSSRSMFMSCALLTKTRN